MREFIKNALEEIYGQDYEQIFDRSKLLQYLDSKMGAIEGNSKTRRSLGNIYAIYSITSPYVNEFYMNREKYKNFEGYEFTKLFSFCRSLYGGERLQNHALNNRVNGEFLNMFKGETKEPIIINNGKYAVHIDYLYVDNIDISKGINKVIETYIGLLRAKDCSLISDIEELSKIDNVDEKKKKLNKMLDEKSEARIFEILSFAILKNHYKNIQIFIGYSVNSLKKEYLTLYKTGRTNANDGGIDFVMRPLGRFFQVTEVDNYNKYTLDMDKVLHFPITFVIKTTKDKEIIKKELLDYIEVKSGGMKIIKDRYFKSIEEIITINELHTWLFALHSEEINSLLIDLETYYRLELNIPINN